MSRTLRLLVGVALFAGLELWLGAELGRAGSGLALVATVAWLWVSEARKLIARVIAGRAEFTR